jgi:hypothetical protein
VSAWHIVAAVYGVSILVVAVAFVRYVAGPGSLRYCRVHGFGPCIVGTRHCPRLPLTCSRSRPRWFVIRSRVAAALPTSPAFRVWDLFEAEAGAGLTYVGTYSSHARAIGAADRRVHADAAGLTYVQTAAS